MRWQTSSRLQHAASPVRLSKSTLVRNEHYRGNFSAYITKDHGERMRTLYEERSCLRQRNMESCTDMDSSCLWFDKHKTCNTNSKRRVKVPFHYRKSEQRQERRIRESRHRREEDDEEEGDFTSKG